MVSLNSANSVTKIVVLTVKGLKAAISCVKDQDITTAPEIHIVRDSIFELRTTYASVIYQIP